ncbi:MAG: helix-hairpin-helix domain-containing protein [Flavobacteriaceae bacterium]|nr:helix-hairpin-helix domain-containing protein [Flavobacteriaceae bacterium]RZW53941.1 MAG: helix-hairpin-helix domain-containing protein [Flavobacteriaceae bacterium]
MKYLRSHFKFTKQQRNGIFLLLFLIIALQSSYYYIDLSSDNYAFSEAEYALYQEEIAALKLKKIEENKPKLFPFNPNFITDFKGYTLGMSNEEIDRLHKFRASNQWVNSAKDFQRVTKVSDSLLASMSPLFKFPEWVTHPKPSRNYNTFTNSPKSYDQKIDLNKATAKQLQRVNGIGEKLSDRIVSFRNKFNDGFIADVQLQDVYGLSPEVVERVLQQFTVKTPRKIEKIDLNTATMEQLVTIQHIDYEIASEIIEQRTLREGFNSFDELSKVKEFPIHKIDIIKLYLKLE